MNNNKHSHIIILEPSLIIAEGLVYLINKQSKSFEFSIINSLEKIDLITTRKKTELIIINPSYIQNNTKSFNNIKNEHHQIKWIGLIYAYFEQELLDKLDDLITISDTIEVIYGKINKQLNQENHSNQTNSPEILSEREIDVLKLLAVGLTNKEIADKLSISIHTVISHRKNISQKTGIKSVSGLTIYAVLQKIISTDSLSL
jgi:DNA-binding CsgD family transcriptional regulator